jgi:7-keto-8-aminopelargonate synthetase-like enzyme
MAKSLDKLELGKNAQSHLMQSPPGAEVVVDGKPYLYFGGTSYLGLAGRGDVINAACDATRRYGIHTATSRSGYGTNPVTLAVETLAAGFFGTETASFFASGYVGNHILVQASDADLVVIDELAHHASREAAKLAQKPIVPFRRDDLAGLRSLLRERLTPGQSPLLMIDGVCPATGAVAPLIEIIEVLHDFDRSTIIVDDAHGVGALGQNGRGTIEHLGLWDERVNHATSTTGMFIRMSATLSKALGGFGGILPLSNDFADRIRKTSHYWDGASAPAAPIAGASARSLEIVIAEPQLRDRLNENVATLRAALRGLGLTVEDWPTPIIGLSVGRAEDMIRIHQTLLSQGILVPYIRSYAGAGAQGLVRIAVFATHTREMIDRLVGAMKSAV